MSRLKKREEIKRTGLVFNQGLYYILNSKVVDIYPENRIHTCMRATFVFPNAIKNVKCFPSL